MNNVIELILYMIFLHWVADFVFQTHWQASNKSKNWVALSSHVLTYTIAICVGLTLYMENRVGLEFREFWPFLATWTLVNGVLHFVTDAITSRINTYLWNKGSVHNFFVSVGFDQVLHYFALIGSFFYLLGV